MEVNVLDSDKLEKPELTKPSTDQEVYNITPLLTDLDGIDIKLEQSKDQELVRIQRSLDGEHPPRHYLMLDDILYHIDADEQLKLVIPKDIRNDLISSVHTGHLGGHMGRDKTYEKISSRYFWSGMTKDVFGYLEACVECKQANLQRVAPDMQESTCPTFPFEFVALDFAGPYPETEQGNLYVLTVVDLFSGFITAVPVPDKTAETTAKVIMESIIPVHSVPLRILTDRGGEFRNRVMELLCQKLNIGHIITSPFNPQANGRCERTHRAMTSCLMKICNKDQSDWDQCLPFFTGAFNTSKSSASKFSPFYLVFARDPILPVQTLLHPRRKYMGADYFPSALERMHISYRLVRRHLHKQTKKNQKQKQVKNQDIEVGDAVYLHNNNRQNKLQKKWLPHYRVIRKRGPVSFTIKQQLTGQIRDAHAKDLRKASDKELWVQDKQPHRIRQTGLVVPDTESSSSGSELSDSESDESDDDDTIIYEPPGPVLQAGPAVQAPQAADPEVDQADLSGDEVIHTPEPEDQVELEQAADPEEGQADLSNEKLGQGESIDDKEVQIEDSDDKLGQTDSDWSSDDNIPLQALRKKQSYSRRHRQAKEKAKLKMKNLFLCISELMS